MSNEAKGPYWIEWSNGSRTGSVVGPNYEGPFMTVCEAKIHCDALNAAYLAGQQDRTPPDPDAHIEDQEQYLEAKSKRFSAKTEGESTAEVERAMKGEPSPSVLPVFTEEEIERMAMDICPGETSQVMKATHPTHTILSQGANIREHIKFTLRYANTKAVSVDRITEVVEQWNYSPHVHLFGGDERKFSERKLNDFRTRLTSLFNGEG